MESNKNSKYDMIYLYLTGFGVFDDEEENPTEQLINEVNINKGNEFNTKHTCIKYAEVYEVNSKYVNEKFSLLQNEIYQRLQETNNSEMSNNNNNVLHVILNYGLSASSKKMKIETNAVNCLNEFPYKVFNNKNHYLTIDEAYDAKHKITSKINIPMLVQIIREIKGNDKLNVVQSFDAGTYLCNYLMYKSIKFSYMHDNVLATFVHIPLKRVFSLEQNVFMLKKIIEAFETMYINK